MSALATAAYGCMLPPPVDEVDPAANRAPTITAIAPPEGEPVTLSCDQGRSFIATIGDPDVRDRLFFRFFVDYYRQDPNDLLGAEIGESDPVPTGQSRLAQTPSTGISGRDSIIQERPNDVHIVELLVVDREFDDANPDIAAAFTARVPVAGGLTATYQWAIEPVVCN
ncbi:MAG: hypothetical protein H7Z43_00390 [Clostridia bacterium]|nr:hypothetical protein [Deltaproteobacteria bacterium]